MKIFPSIISADLLNLEHVLKTIDSAVDGYHIDIMDGYFVPNLTWGPMFVKALRTITNRPFQVHVMVNNPAAWISRLTCVPGDSFIFHIEAVMASDVSSLIEAARKTGWRVGLAINPDTPIERITQYLPELDEVLVMAVNPGFSGQSFIDIVPKIQTLRTLSSKAGVQVPLIAVDGGVNLENIARLALVGVEIVGAAAAIFNEDDVIKNIQNLRQASIS